MEWNKKQEVLIVVIILYSSCLFKKKTGAKGPFWVPYLKSLLNIKTGYFNC
jgi:hypothetical protein